MNLWKATALVLTSAFALMIGYSVASANPGDAKPAPVAGGEYYHMRVALEHLRAARWELQTAEHNRSGWRERAVEATDRAIYETRVAMDY
jgi:hypothetical protein